MEDRVLQASVARILSAIYEPLFQEQSYGSGRVAAHMMHCESYGGTSLPGR